MSTIVGDHLDTTNEPGRTGAPVVKIGSEWIVGFDRQRVDRAPAAPRSRASRDRPAPKREARRKR